MGKIAPVSSKYVVHVTVEADGVFDRPDIIGAIFGQTEGLLGEELELRELQKSGRIGRIEVELENKDGKTTGKITIPSSLNKEETAIIAAAVETIQRVGPCNAKLKVEKIEDMRLSKREYLMGRAKELLQNFVEDMPDSQEMTGKIKDSFRVEEIIEYGPDKLPAGPLVDSSEEIIIVEGRADVNNLLKNGFKNVLAINGTSIPQTVIDLCGQKIVTLFVDGDRGGDLIIQELASRADVDFFVKAPDGKEVEELTSKEIHKCLRARIPADSFKSQGIRKPMQRRTFRQPRFEHKIRIPDKLAPEFKRMFSELIGTRSAYIIDENLNIQGKVPVSEVATIIMQMDKVFAVILDSNVTEDIVKACSRKGVKYAVGADADYSGRKSRTLTVVTQKDLE